MNLLFKFILFFSKMPLKILYLFSDMIFLVAYYLIDYRKNVVKTNLENSFPNHVILLNRPTQSHNPLQEIPL